ncbi:MAG: DUF484 family protein [Pseudomonadota bacterium]
MAKSVSVESQAVLEFLQIHRDFFLDHPELLLDLNIPHVGRGESVSLIERQVEVLRGRCAQLENQLQDLLEVARENDRLSERMHHFAQGLLEAEDLDALLDAILARLSEDFRVEHIALRLRQPDWMIDAERPEWVARVTLQPFLDLLPMARPKVGVELDAAHKEVLFGRAAGMVRSVALLPLHAGDTFGLIALGSRDPERYEARAGTLILGRLGELATAALGKWMQRRR